MEREKEIEYKKPLARFSFLICFVAAAASHPPRPTPRDPETQRPRDLAHVTLPCPTLTLLWDYHTMSSCPECGHTDIVEDWKQGDSICRNCGLVGERLIDPGEEKRHFADSDENPHRTSAENSYVHSLGTTMSALPGSRSNLTRIADHTISNNDRNIISGIEKIARWCSYLKLAPRITAASKDLYSKFEKNRPKFTRGKDQVTFIAIICIACKYEGFARSYKELASETGVDVKQLRKNCTRIQKVLDQPRTDAVEAKDLIPRICDQLRLSYKNMRYVEDVSARVCPYLTGKRPNTVAAVSIKLVCDAVGDSRFEKEIAAASGITASTLRSGFKQLQAVPSSELLPADLLAVAPPRAILPPSPPDPASGLSIPAFPGSPVTTSTSSTSTSSVAATSSTSSATMAVVAGIPPQ